MNDYDQSEAYHFTSLCEKYLLINKQGSPVWFGRIHQGPFVCLLSLSLCSQFAVNLEWQVESIDYNNY
jgi:hypothetical protein